MSLHQVSLMRLRFSLAKYQDQLELIQIWLCLIKKAKIKKVRKYWATGTHGMDFEAEHRAGTAWYKGGRPLFLKKLNQSTIPDLCGTDMDLGRNIVCMRFISRWLPWNFALIKAECNLLRNGARSYHHNDACKGYDELAWKDADRWTFKIHFGVWGRAQAGESSQLSGWGTSLVLTETLR
jgi:hypothetical protein